VATRCIASAGIGVCTLDTENHCDTAVCPSPLRCVSDECRTQCSTDDDCLAHHCALGTCAEPVSGRDAGPSLDAPTTSDAGTDAFAGPDAPAGTCTLVPQSSLAALGLGSAPSGTGLRAGTTFVTELTSARPAVLALTTLERGGTAGAFLATADDGAPQVWQARADQIAPFSALALYSTVDEAYAIDLSSSATDLVAMVMRQAASAGDAFGYGHDDSFETGLATGPLSPGGTSLAAGTTFHGAIAIVGGQSPFSATAVPVFHVFHTHDDVVGASIGGTDRGRSAGNYRSIATVPPEYQSDVLEMATAHGPLVVMRDPSSTSVAYWRPSITPGAPMVELATTSTTLPGVASLDGDTTLLAWASGSNVQLTRVDCSGNPCLAPEMRGTIALTSSPVTALAMTALVSGYVLAVGRADLGVDVYLVDDTGGGADAMTFADVPGASGGRVVSPMPFASAAAIRSIRVDATPFGGPAGGAAVMIAVLEEETSTHARRIWTASFLSCAL
jgi:hypothetical protein